MGDFARHTTRDMSESFIHDEKGERIGYIRMFAGISRSESWAHLHERTPPPSNPNEPQRPREMAGPHNRQIIETVTGYSVVGHALETATAEQKQQIETLIKELNQEQLISSAEQGAESPDPSEVQKILEQRIQLTHPWTLRPMKGLS